MFHMKHRQKLNQMVQQKPTIAKAMTSRKPWMPFYVGDYLADTGHLNTLQHGAYILLLLHYWMKRKLPTDDRQLASICRLSLKQWLSNRSTLAAFFNDDWTHNRIETELKKAENIVEKRKEAGTVGGLASAAARRRPSPAREMTPAEKESFGRLANLKQKPTPSQSQSPKLSFLAPEAKAAPVDNVDKPKATEQASEAIPPSTPETEISRATKELFSRGVATLIDMTGIDESYAFAVVSEWVRDSDAIYVLAAIDAIKGMREQGEDVLAVPMINAQILKYKPLK